MKEEYRYEKKEKKKKAHEFSLCFKYFEDYLSSLLMVAEFGMFVRDSQIGQFFNDSFFLCSQRTVVSR